MSTQQMRPEVERFLARAHGHLIAGEWLTDTSAARIPVFNPGNGQQIASIAAGTAADVDRAVASARRAFEHPSWAQISPSKRGQLLWRLAELIESHAETLAELEYLDNGKSRQIVARGDIPAAADTFRYFAGWATKIYGQTMELSRPGTLHAYTLKEPVGVAGLIVPWNFPLLMAAWKLAPALAAGCACVLKPAEETSLTALLLGELVLEAGIPPGVVNIVTGVGSVVGAALAAHPGVDKVAFTGSTEVGKLIVQAASGNLKKLSLELGGKSPTIILSDARLGQAKEAAANGIFFNAGQVCAAGSRLFAHRSVFDAVLESVIARARGIRVGPGDDPQAQMGPLISAKHLDRVESYVSSGREQGARVAVGGERIARAGYFFEPTVLLDAQPRMRVSAEEIFGPVLLAAPFDDLDEVAALANDSVYGLSASIWTQDLTAAHALARKLHAGAVRINTGGGNDPNLPFGGYKQSGWGREFGAEGLELYLQTKSVLVGA